MLRESSLAVTVAAVGSLCTSCAMPPPPTTTGPLTFDEYVVRAAAATCASLERCGRARELATTFRTEVTDCATQLADYELAAIYGPLRAAVARGSIVFHPDGADACFAALAAQACGAAGTPSVCSALFEPTVADGGTCASSLECVSGGLCVYAGTCGTCQPMRGAGGCTASADCEFGWYCDAGACMHQSDVGEPCDVAIADACRTSLDCVDGACATRVRGEGARCRNDFECTIGQHCVATTCAPLPSGTCLRQADCPTSQYCKTDDMQSPHACAAYPAVGEPCVGACASGAFCPIGFPGLPVCVATDGANDSACTADSDCFTHHCVSGVCAYGSMCVP